MKKIALFLAMLMLAGCAGAEEFFAEEDAPTAGSAFSEDFFAEDDTDEAPEDAADSEERSIVATGADPVSSEDWAQVTPALSVWQAKKTTGKGAKKKTVPVLGSVTFSWSLDVSYDSLAALAKTDPLSAYALHLYLYDGNTDTATDVKTVAFSKKMKQKDGTLGGTFTLGKHATGNYRYFVRLEKTTRSAKKSKTAAETCGSRSDIRDVFVCGTECKKTGAVTFDNGLDEADPRLSVRWPYVIAGGNHYDAAGNLAFGFTVKAFITYEGASAATDVSATVDSVLRNNTSMKTPDGILVSTPASRGEDDPAAGCTDVTFTFPENVSPAAVKVTVTPVYTAYDNETETAYPACTGTAKTASWKAPAAASSWKKLTSVEIYKILMIGYDYQIPFIHQLSLSGTALPDRITFKGMNYPLTISVAKGSNWAPDSLCSLDIGVVSKAADGVPSYFSGSATTDENGDAVSYQISFRFLSSPTAKVLTVIPQKKSGKKYVNGTKSTAAVNSWRTAPVLQSVRQTGDRVCSLSFTPPADAQRYAVKGFAEDLVIDAEDKDPVILNAEAYPDYTLTCSVDSVYTLTGPVKKAGKNTFTVTPQCTPDGTKYYSGTAMKAVLNVTAAAATAGLNIRLLRALDGSVTVTFTNVRPDAARFRVTLVRPDSGKNKPYDPHWTDSYEFTATPGESEYSCCFSLGQTEAASVLIETFLSDGSRLVDTVNGFVRDAAVAEAAPDASFVADDIAGSVRLTDSESGETLGFIPYVYGNYYELPIASGSVLRDEGQDWRCDSESGTPLSWNGSICLFSTDNVSLRFSCLRNGVHTEWSEPVELACYTSMKVNHRLMNGVLTVSAEGGIKDRGYTYSVTIRRIVTGGTEPYCPDGVAVENCADDTYTLEKGSYRVTVKADNTGVNLAGSPLTKESTFEVSVF